MHSRGDRLDMELPLSYGQDSFTNLIMSTYLGLAKR